MTSWGYTLSSEEFAASDLLHHAELAEDAGFDFVTVSDHYHPWIQEQGHSPFAWSTVGAVAGRTSRVEVGTGVTCPIMRYHPSIVAQAAATSAELLGGRFFLGVGTGEALNEHIHGEAWPALERRQSMLVEALQLMRQLWTGETVDFWGDHYTVENARIFTTAPGPIPVIWAASGPSSARLAADHADGLWSTSPSAEVVEAYRSAGGTGPVYGQLTVCWDADEQRARETARRVWPNAGMPGQMSQDLPTWTHFEQLATLVTEEHVAAEVLCGPYAEPIVEQARRYLDAGFDHLHFHQVGPDQSGFIAFWNERLATALDGATTAAR